MSEERPRYSREERVRIFVVAAVCTAVALGWYLVFRVGVLDDVLPAPVDMMDF